LKLGRLESVLKRLSLGEMFKKTIGGWRGEKGGIHGGKEGSIFNKEGDVANRERKVCLYTSRPIRKLNVSRRKGWQELQRSQNTGKVPKKRTKSTTSKG